MGKYYCINLKLHVDLFKLGIEHDGGQLEDQKKIEYYLLVKSIFDSFWDL